MFCTPIGKSINCAVLDRRQVRRHLGTARAVQGLDIAESKPFFCPGPGINFLKRITGGDDYRYLRASRGALYDRQPVSYGSLIDWLNQQPHPDIAYYGVIRGGPVGDGDELVPAVSQDLNQVPVLQGRVTVLVTPTSHGLGPRDGILLADILDGISWDLLVSYCMAGYTIAPGRRR